MRLMLRELQMNYPRLCEVMDAIPESDRLSRDELQEALTTLTQQQWLNRIGEGEKAIYKVNLRRREGSKLAAGIWSALDAKLKKNPSDP
jgi:predicted transcriptional regulator of viral defense system